MKRKKQIRHQTNQKTAEKKRLRREKQRIQRHLDRQKKQQRG